MSYVPSGLAFSASGKHIDYEFRVKVASYFLRFEGRFAGERALLDRLAGAIAKPADFIRDSDPEYALNRIIELDKAFEILSQQLEIQNAKLVLLQKQIEAMQLSLARLPELESEMQAKLEAEQERSRALEATQNLIARSAMASLSKGFFSSAKAPTEEVVAYTVAQRTNNPAATAQEILTSLKADGLESDQKQIKAILSVLYGEY